MSEKYFIVPYQSVKDDFMNLVTIFGGSGFLGRYLLVN